jgi:hypothetical protein
MKKLFNFFLLFDFSYNSGGFSCRISQGKFYGSLIFSEEIFHYFFDDFSNDWGIF